MMKSQPVLSSMAFASSGLKMLPFPIMGMLAFSFAFFISSKLILPE